MKLKLLEAQVSRLEIENKHLKQNQKQQDEKRGSSVETQNWTTAVSFLREWTIPSTISYEKKEAAGQQTDSLVLQEISLQNTHIDELEMHSKQLVHVSSLMQYDPLVVPIYEYSLDAQKNTLHILTPRYDGTLLDLIQTQYYKNLSFEDKQYWAVLTAKALEYLHSRGFVHGSVNLSCFFVQWKDPKSQKVHISQLGTGFNRLSSFSARQILPSGQELHFSILSAPEKQHGITEQTDMYELNGVLWELLHGTCIERSPKTLPHVQDSIPCVWKKIFNQNWSNDAQQRIRCYDLVQQILQ